MYRGYIKLDAKYELVAIKTGKGAMISILLYYFYFFAFVVISSIGSD